MEAQITSYDNKARVVNLSIKAIDKAEAKPSKAKSSEKTEIPVATLGDLLKEQLASRE